MRRAPRPEPSHALVMGGCPRPEQGTERRLLQTRAPAVTLQGCRVRSLLNRAGGGRDRDAQRPREAGPSAALG